MRTLYHLPLDAGSRFVRVLLGEKKLPVTLQPEKIWERRRGFLTISPGGELPALVEPDGTALPGALVIAEYLDEAYPEPPLLGLGALDRAEARRLCHWFQLKFDREVTRNLVGEKLMKRFLGRGQPDSQAIRAGHANLTYHLDYIGWLTERRSWLAGDSLTLADLAAAAHLSCLDYLGDVPWHQATGAKEWYQRIKCRPSFRPILGDLVAGSLPPKHYADLDF